MKIKKRTEVFYQGHYSLPKEAAACLAAAYDKCADNAFQDDYYHGAHVGMILMLFSCGYLTVEQKDHLLNEESINAYYFTSSLAGNESQ